MATTFFPSVSAKTESSSPSIHSSTTTWQPASPNAWPESMPRTASTASSVVRHITTPLPAARPDAFTTTFPSAERTYASAAARSVKQAKAAVGMPWRCISPFAKALLLSISAAPMQGPKAQSPCAWKWSTIPAASGASGPTTVRSTAFPSAHPASDWCSSASSGSEVAPSIPPFALVTKNSASGASRRSFQSSALSRPPFPTIRIFTVLHASRAGPRPAPGIDRYVGANGARMNARPC